MHANRLQRRLRSRLLALIASLLFLQGLVGIGPAAAACISANVLESTSASSGTYETCGGDDLSYKIPLSGTVVFGGVTYTSIYATNNSVITFGRRDGTFHTFPSTPSISLDSQDWVQRGFINDNGSTFYPTQPDEFFNITVNGSSFRVDIAARPFQNYQFAPNVPTTALTRIIFDFVRNNDGTLRITAFSSNSTDLSLRNGCVLSQGAAAISLEACGVTIATVLEQILDRDEKVNYLVATTPLKVSQSSDEILCQGAELKYMVQGIQPTTAHLDSQIFALKIDDKIVATKSTTTSGATFVKALLPKTGIASCTQIATQEGSQVVVQSVISSVNSNAAQVRKSEVAKINADFKQLSQQLMSKKLSHLVQSSASTVSYREASEIWKSALLSAEFAKDKAIKVAFDKEAKAGFVSGNMLQIKP